MVAEERVHLREAVREAVHAAAIEEAEPKNVGEYVAPLGMQAWLFQKIASRKSA